MVALANDLIVLGWLPPWRRWQRELAGMQRPPQGGVGEHHRAFSFGGHDQHLRRRLPLGAERGVVFGIRAPRQLPAIVCSNGSTAVIETATKGTGEPKSACR